MQALHLMGISRDYLGHLQQVSSDPSYRTIPLPTETMQKALRGLRSEELTILGGFEGHGKSALAQQIAWAVADQFAQEDGDLADDAKRLVCYHSLEMGRNQLLSRFLVQRGGWDLDALMNPERLTPRDWTRLKGDLEETSKLQMMVFDSAKQSTGDIHRAVSDLRDGGMGQPKLLVVDYFHLLSDCLGGDVARLDEGVTILKDLARLAKVHVIAICRLNRNIQGGELPNTRHIAGSQGLAYGADNVIFVHRPALMDGEVEESWENYAHLVVRKARNGPVGVYDLMWNPERLTYRDLTIFETSRRRKRTTNQGKDHYNS